jgi:hypothetical protein
VPSFRTKRGRCHVDDGRLRLDSSLRGQLRRYREGGRRFLWGYVGALLAGFGFLLVELAAGDSRTVLLVCGTAVAVVVVARVVNARRGFTTTDEIPLDAIDHVRPVRGTRGLTRPRFVVGYERDGEQRRRYVMMPSLWLPYGAETFRRAKETFRDAGLAVEE